jgi:hypothetical protein
MPHTLQTVFREHFPDYAATHKLPAHQHRAAQLIGACRSAALGAHVQGCPEGHVIEVQYNSCRHRLCAQCAGLARERWLEAERARLLPLAHHHVIFTIPHEFNPLWRYNRAAFANLLFASVSATLKELLADPRYLGAEPGLLLALHTWGRSLFLHPHIHALVSDGGLAAATWATPRRSHFLPARVVMALFRGKLLAGLRALLEAGTLALPPETSAQRLANLCNQLGRTKWNVRVCPRYAHGEGVVRYLARYVRGGPLKNGQLETVSEHEVAFRYTPHEDEATPSGAALLRLAPQAFLARYLEHTPMPGQHQVRRYGLYAPSRAGALAQARTLIAPTPQTPTAAAAPAALTWQAYLGRFAQCAGALRCPVCARPIVFLGRLSNAQAPPAAALH